MDCVYEATILWNEPSGSDWWFVKQILWFCFV